MKDISEIVDRVLTREEGEELMRYLEELITKRANAGDAKKLPLAISEKLSGIEERLSIRELLSDFQREYSSRPVVKMTLAFEPDRDFIKNIAGFFSDNLEQKVVLDLVVDPLIIGGAKIICNDHYKDYSLASRI